MEIGDGIINYKIKILLIEGETINEKFIKGRFIK